MINIGTDVLVTANWCSLSYKAMYKEVADKHGMAYYVETDDLEGFKFVQNSNYKDIPPLRMIDTRFMSKLAVSASQPMYQIGVNDPQTLDFLNNPEKYIVELAGITS